MKRILIVAAFAFVALSVHAQQEVKLTVNHMLGNNGFAFNTEAENDMGHKFKLQRLEYYVSGISITHDGGKVSTAPSVYILFKANRKDTISLGEFDVTNLESISFSVGVDPSVNNQDPAGWKSDHALAPKLPSMHWGWSAGYRFVALEGKSGNNFAQDFQIHALGNQNFFKQNIPTKGIAITGGLLISLNADYTKAVSQIGMEQGLFEHSEANEAASCLRNFQTKVFANLDGEGNTLSTFDQQIEEAFQIFPNPSIGEINIQIEDPRFLDGKMIVTNILGETILQLNDIISQNQLNIQTPGVYFLTIQKDGFVSTKRLVVN